MAQPTTVESLKDSVIRYLKICENLGDREMVLRPETVEALNALRNYPNKPASQLERKVDSAVSMRTAPEQPKKMEVSFRKPMTSQTGVRLPRETFSGRDLAGKAKQEALEIIREEILTDARLPQLFKRAQNMVFGTGNIDAQIMFIGEAPGAEEDQQGEPFVGAAGQLLDKMIVAMGLKREDVYIANVVKYRPDMPEGSRGNRKPTPDELTCCRPHILRQISVIQPAVIVGLGATAMEGLLDQPRVSITRLRGQWENFEKIPLMPTFHPAYLLHNSAVSEKRKVWEDLLQVMGEIGLPISEKQQRYFLPKR